MSDALDFLMLATAIGVGATLTMDIWGAVRRSVFGGPSVDYAMVGRWVGHMAHGRFRHASIAAAPPVPAERTIGWTLHYLIGIGFAAILLAIWGTRWADDPTLPPALIVGLTSVAAPFLIMQPAFGLGIAASRTPAPFAARMRSLLTHLVFGIGLYISGLAASLAFGG